jgi:hypothetical protein
MPRRSERTPRRHVRDSYDGIACIEPGQPPHPHRRIPRGATAVVFVTSLDAVRDLLDSGVAIEAEGDPGPVILLPRLDQAVLAKLHEAGICVACRNAEHWGHAQAGMFAYEHLCDNWIAGPYGLHERPKTPLRASDLAPEARASPVKIPGRFAENRLVQPAHHVPCQVWSEGYAACLDVDGKTVRPLPGREASYATALDDLYANHGEAIERGDLIIVDAPEVPSADLAPGDQEPQ